MMTIRTDWVKGASVCRDVVVGTEAGTLHVLRLEAGLKKERTWAPLARLGGGADTMPLRACHQQVPRHTTCLPPPHAHNQSSVSAR